MKKISRKIKDIVPKELREIILKSRSHLNTLFTQVERESKYTNIYHCCVQKTASQWLRRIMSDKVVYKYSGLRWTYYPTWRDDSTKHSIIKNPPKKGFSDNTIVSPIYMSYDTYKSMSKSKNHNTFFVKRDPRDIVVSYYHSMVNTHLKSDITKAREELSKKDQEDGLIKSINILNRFLFPSLKSWEKASTRSDKVSVWRYENLTNNKNNYRDLKKLMHKMDVKIPKDEFNQMMEKYSFKNISGRSKGEEDRTSAFRKGVHGDWRDQFTKRVNRHFEKTTNELHKQLGYE